MAEQKRYRGGCHCGAVRYEIRASFDTALSCNCSICRKRGVLWTYISPADFDLLSGKDALVDYQFNQRLIHHVFCRICGVGSFSTGRGEDGSEGIGINIRCLEDVDVESLPVTFYDGRSL
jgi:hypothetical protein